MSTPTAVYSLGDGGSRGETQKKMKLINNLIHAYRKRKYGITDEEDLTHKERAEINMLNGYHPKIKWEDQANEEKNLNRKKFIKYQNLIQSNKFNI